MATAGTVTTKGDTNISIGGFIQTYFVWANNQTGLGYQANPKTATNAVTAFGTTSEHSRLSLGINNKPEGIKGLIEGDFYGGGAGEELYGKGNFDLRHAYFVKEFCQEGCNYTPWLLIGRTWDPAAILENFTLNDIVGMAGQNGGKGVVRTSQIGFGVKFDLGSVKLNPAIYAANVGGDSTFGNSGVLYNSTPELSQRLTSPGFAFKLPVEFSTGLGAPASVEGVFEWQPMKLSGQFGPYSINSENENAWIGSVSATLPIYFVTLMGAFQYERGMTGFDMPLFGAEYAMPSFYVDNNGSIQPVHGTSWTAQAQFDFEKLVQMPFTFSLGYGQTVYSNYSDLANQTVEPLVRKMGTMFANVNYHLTKSATIGIEYDRNRTYYVGAGNDGGDAQNGNQIFLRAMYSF